MYRPGKYRIKRQKSKYETKQIQEELSVAMFKQENGWCETNINWECIGMNLQTRKKWKMYRMN